MKKTPLYEKHIELNAKLVDFAGYMMPIQYDSITKEHFAVRESAGIFDVSHMGEIIISGKGSQEFLEYITVNDITNLEPWQVQYSAMCFEDGGIVDDLLVYRYPDYFMLVVNCSNTTKDFDWLMAHKPKDVDIIDISQKIGLIALQGPKSREILNNLIDVEINKMKYYQFEIAKFDNFPCTISRTGYTGELGYEIYADNKNIVKIWDAIMAEGSGLIHPAGLGCRDTLRLEMKYALYGNDIDENTNPIEAGLGWITKLSKKNNFVGKDALEQINNSLSRDLVCIKMVERGIPRKGYDLFYNDTMIGKITSGTQSPTLNVGIGLGYVQKDFSKIGVELYMLVRGKKIKCKIVDSPFFRKGSLKN